MTDPIYGDNPFDAAEAWNATFRPPMVLDPTWQAWRNVFVAAMADVLESSWLTRWRRSLVTAEGEQLRIRGEELSYLRPAGWTDDRYQAVLSAIFSAALTQPTTATVFALAEALADVGQSWTIEEHWPCSATFYYLETDADDAVSYLSALDRARPRGCEYRLVAHPGGGLSPFGLDSSTLDGPDTLAELFML